MSVISQCFRRPRPFSRVTGGVLGGLMGVLSACSPEAAPTASLEELAAGPVVSASSAATTTAAPSALRSGALLRVGSGAETAQITRDAYGVPRIDAAEMAGVFFGAGYAQAQDRLVQMELTRHAVEGKLSELFGASQLDQDQTVRTFFYTDAELLAQYDRLPKDFRSALVAYSHGVNAYLAEAYASPTAEQALVPYQFFVLGKVMGMAGPYHMADWAPTDSVAVGNYLARHAGDGGGLELENQTMLQYLTAERKKAGVAHPDTEAMAIFNDAQWINDPSAPTTVPKEEDLEMVDSAALPYVARTRQLSGMMTEATPGLTPRTVRAVPAQVVQAAAAALQAHNDHARRVNESLKVPFKDGSDAFVVAPSHTRDGKALLFGGPQQGFGTPSVDGEQQLHGPDYDVAGMYLAGSPFVLVGMNRHIAWTTTTEELVLQQIYQEQVDFTASPPKYLFKGHWQPMVEIHHTINVAGQPPQDFIVHRTVHGPVFFADVPSGTAYAMKYASWDKETGTLEGFAGFGAAQNLAEFREAVSHVATLHNFLYADRHGNIAYFAAGLLPILPTCADCDPRFPHLGDGSQEWLGIEPFSRMPHSINPAQGYLVNWNTKPDSRHYIQQNPRDEYWGTIFRSDRIASLLRHERTADLTTLSAIAHDIGTMDGNEVYRPTAPYFLPHLFAAYLRLRLAHDPLVSEKLHPQLATAIAALRAWDQTTALGSPAMSIYVQFMAALMQNTLAGGVNAGEAYVGAVNLNDSSLKLGTYPKKAGYNLLYHALAGTRGLVPCDGMCLSRDYFGGHRDAILVESLNDALTLLSGTGPIYANGKAHGFGTTDITHWGWVPYADIDWDDLDPLSVGISPHLGQSAAQEHSTYVQMVELAREVKGVNLLPPGQSAFISSSGVPDAHFGDQIPLFNAFHYKPLQF